MMVVNRFAIGLSFAIVFGLLDPIAAQELDTAVARRTFTFLRDGQEMVFAKKGETLKIVQRLNDQVLVTATTGQKGRVPAADIVAFKDSASVFDELIRESPREMDLYLIRASVWSENGDYKRAIEDCSRAITIEPKNAHNFVNRGVYHSSDGNLDAAISDYSRAIEFGSKETTTFINRGLAYLNKRDYDRAIRDFDEVIRRHPKEAKYYIRRGVAWRQQQKWDQAIADFDKAHELEPTNRTAIGSRGFVRYLSGDHAGAVKDFDLQIKLSPESFVAYNNRGFNRQMLGDYKNALADYDKAISLNQEYALALQNKAWLLATCPEEKHRNGRVAFETARTLYAMREVKAPSDIKALAASYAEMGDFKNAAKFQTTVIEMLEGDSKELEQDILKLYKADQPYRFKAPSDTSEDNDATSGGN